MNALPVHHGCHRLPDSVGGRIDDQFHNLLDGGVDRATSAGIAGTGGFLLIDGKRGCSKCQCRAQRRHDMRCCTSESGETCHSIGHHFLSLNDPAAPQRPLPDEEADGVKISLVFTPTAKHQEVTLHVRANGRKGVEGRLWPWAEIGRCRTHPSAAGVTPDYRRRGHFVSP